MGYITNSSDIDHNLTCKAVNYPGVLAFVAYGILCPIISISTLITTIFIIVIFTRKNMRSPTTVLLVGLAISDIFAGNILMPMFIYLYAIPGNRDTEIPYPFCAFQDYAYILAASFHTASVLLTTALGIQRFIVVAYPFIGPRVCNTKVSFAIIFSVYVVSFVMCLPFYFYTSYVPVWSMEEDGTMRQICYCIADKKLILKYNKVVNLLRCTLGQLIPCGILVVTTSLLFRKLKIQTRQILLLHADEKTEERRDFRHIRRTSQMIIVIAITFLLVEIPNGIVFALQIDNELDPSIEYPLAIILNFFVFLSYHMNFWIYMSLSARFRASLKKLLWLDKKCLRKRRKISLSVGFEDSCLSKTTFM